MAASLYDRAMDVPWWIILPLIVVAFAIIARILRAQSSGPDDMIARQMRESRHPPVSAGAQGATEPNLLDQPDILLQIEQGRKIEAIKMVRERFGLGLKEAKLLVDRHSS